jgi:tyrosyl-tRNA synthetase
MNPMVPGLTGGKMSASDPDSKIDVLDGPELVKKKLKKAYAAAGEVEGEGEPLVYHDMETLRADYKADKLTPQLLKAGVTAALNELLAPIQADYQASPEWQEIEKKAYPPAEPTQKKKQPKNKGSRYPGAGDVKANPDGTVAGEGKEQVEVSKTAEDAMSKLEIDGRTA